MAQYESRRYPALGFYVEGGFRRFSGGLYSTDDPAEIAVLDALTDVSRKDESKTEEAAEATAKPAPKPRKPAAKANASE